MRVSMLVRWGTALAAAFMVAACSDTVLALAHGRIVEPEDAPVPLPHLPLTRSTAPGAHRSLAP